MNESWYGVVSEQKTDTNDYDTLIDTKGDTKIWISDVGGPLKSGDLITTSNVVPGYGQKQEDNFAWNYTIAKVLQDCDFTDPPIIPIKVPKQELSNVTYYTKYISYPIELFVYEKLNDSYKKIITEPIYFKESETGGEDIYYHGETEVSHTRYNTLPEDERSTKKLKYITPEEYEKLEEIEKPEYTQGTKNKYMFQEYSKSKFPIPEHEDQIVVEELVDVIDENGQVVWEETSESESLYKLVDHGTHKAALLKCKIF